MGTLPAPADRVRTLPPSATVAAAEQARALRAKGIDVVDLSGGDPDVPTAPHVCEAAAEAMRRGETHYVDGAGIPSLRAAIAAALRAHRGLEVEPDGGVLVTPGGKAALYEALHAYVGPGVDVLLPEPAWVSYRPMVALAGGRVVSVPLGDDFTLSREALERAHTPASRVLLLCSPSNPTGHVLSSAELDAVEAFAVAHDLLVFSDEIYAHLCFDGRPHLSPGARPALRERTLVFDGFSKTYAMTGWRLGWVTGPPSLLAPVRVLHSHLATCAASFAQAAGVAALEGPQDLVGELHRVFDRRRRLVADALSALPGVRCPKPQGAFYAFVDLRQRGESSVALARRLLDEARVAVTPGAAFGEGGEGFIRLALTTGDARLLEGIERIGKVLR